MVILWTSDFACLAALECDDLSSLSLEPAHDVVPRTLECEDLSSLSFSLPRPLGLPRAPGQNTPQLPWTFGVRGLVIAFRCTLGNGSTSGLFDKDLPY